MGFSIQYKFSVINPNRLIAIIDENANETIVSYRADGYVESVTTCLTKQEFSYDLEEGAGQTFMKELVGEENQITSFAYDGQGRNTSKAGNCCGNDNEFVYDANNNITQSTDANGKCLSI